MEKPFKKTSPVRSYSSAASVCCRFLIITVSVVLLGFMYSCGGNSTGIDDDGGNGNGGGNGIDEIGTEPTFSNVGQIFQTTCSPCHISETTNGVRLNTYNNVMNSEGAQYGMNVVVAGDADGSPLVDKIEPSPQFGVRMPEGGPYLSNERIAQIRQWIEDGAENN